MWLERAMKFDEAGHVNPELCDHLALSLNLLEMLEKSRRNRFVRRSAELFFVLTFLITFGLPLFSILALVIKLESPGPILFRQLRLGLLGQPFWIYKFRTMHERAELAAAGNVIPISKSFADPRATRVGKILRRFKLDELPQLLNVVKGDMSLIGPRPLSLDESLCVPQKYVARFAARPGLTGLWQAFLPFPKNPKVKLALDAVYARKQSIRLDLVILLRTIPVLILGEPAGVPPPAARNPPKHRSETEKAVA